jgi:hypothetical protein
METGRKNPTILSPSHAAGLTTSHPHCLGEKGSCKSSGGTGEWRILYFTYLNASMQVARDVSSIMSLNGARDEDFWVGFSIVCFAGAPMSDEGFREHVRKAIETSHRDPTLPTNEGRSANTYSGK